MDITKHCNLCDHQEIDFKTGSFCGLTKRKPDFANKCIKATLNTKLESKIEAINVEYQSVLSIKWLVYINFVVFLIVALVVVLIGYYFAKYLLQFNTISTVPFFIALIGILSVLPIAIGPLNTYKRDLKIAKAKKYDLDTVLKIYNIKYDINISFGKKYHGTQDIDIDLKVKK